MTWAWVDDSIDDLAWLVRRKCRLHPEVRNWPNKLKLRMSVEVHNFFFHFVCQQCESTQICTTIYVWCILLWLLMMPPTCRLSKCIPFLANTWMVLDVCHANPQNEVTISALNRTSSVSISRPQPLSKESLVCHAAIVISCQWFPLTCPAKSPRPRVVSIALPCRRRRLWNSLSARIALEWWCVRHTFWRHQRS